MEVKLNDFEKVDGLAVDVSPNLTDEERQFVQYVNARKTAMANRRAKEESKRKRWEKAVLSYVEPSTDGKARINMPLEQALTELYQGMTPSIIQYKVEPVARVASHILQTGKAIMDHFIKKEQVSEELEKFKYSKAKYGSGILYSGLWFETKFFNDTQSYFSDSTQQKKDIRHIGLKNRDIWSIYFDERAKTSDDAMDCIAEEDLGIEDFRLRYGDKPDIFKYVDTVVGTQMTNGSSSVSTTRNVKVWHYFNKITGRYAIVAQGNTPIYIGNKSDKHGELPFVLVQHYPSDELYGIGIPEKLQSITPYINNILKVILDGAWVSSSMVFATSNDTEIDGELYVDPSEVNVWRFTGDLDQKNFQQVAMQQNQGKLIEILNIMDAYGIQTTGLNIKSSYDSPAGTAFEAGQMQENTNTRLRTVSRSYDYGVEKALNMMLINISQYGPTQYGEFLFSEEGQIKDFKPYEIRVDGKKIITRKDKDGNDYDEFEDDPGGYDFFDLTYDVIDGDTMKLTISTPTTASTSKMMERGEFVEDLKSVATIKQIFPDANVGDGQDRVEHLEYIRGTDFTSQVVRSKEQKIRDEQAEIMNAVNQIGEDLPIDIANETTNQATNSQRIGGIPIPQTIPGQQPMKIEELGPLGMA